jgi:DCN1-like protein 1/2
MASTASQKKALKEFKAIVSGVTEKVATECLTKQQWNVERALDHYYQNAKLYGSSTSGKGGDKAKLNKIFDKYAGGEGKDKDAMFEDKLAAFFKDVGVDPEKEGAVTLGIAWKLKAKTLGEFSRKEFVDGFADLGADTVDKIKSEVSNIRNLLANKTTFRDFYRWVFDYIKEEPERKSVDLEPACEMMSIVLQQHFTLLPEWIEYLKKTSSKQVSKDIWEQVFEFARDIKADLSNYEDDGAWPVVIDEFVDFVKVKKGLKKKDEQKTK